MADRPVKERRANSSARLNLSTARRGASKAWNPSFSPVLSSGVDVPGLGDIHYPTWPDPADLALSGVDPLGSLSRTALFIISNSSRHSHLFAGFARAQRGQPAVLGLFGASSSDD